jgi:2'-5'-oligoadenylate synthetase/2'-5'-oligoadenylate synthase-like protein
MQKPSTTTDFLSLQVSQIAEIIKPKEQIKAEISDVVNEVTNVIRAALKPHKIIKGGSYGKGTNLGDRKEVDLVVVFNDYVPNEDKCKQKVKQLQECLSKGLKDVSPMDDIYAEHKNSTGEIAIRLRSVKLIYKGVKIDVLPAPVLENGAHSFLDMDPKTQLPFASAAASEMQVRFIKNQDARYKDLVRVCKCWRDLEDLNWRNRTKPSSYLIELLALYIYESIDRKHYSLGDAFAKFLHVADSVPLQIWWNRYYTFDIEDKRVPKNQSRLIVDPANPTNNVASTVEDWSCFISNAKDTLLGLYSVNSYELRKQKEAHQSLSKEVQDLKIQLADMKAQMDYLISDNPCTRSLTVRSVELTKKEEISSGIFFVASIPCQWRLSKDGFFQVVQKTNSPKAFTLAIICLQNLQIKLEFAFSIEDAKKGVGCRLPLQQLLHYATFSLEVTITMK